MTDLTVSEFARRFKPQWRFPDDWIYWPPDVFALTSMIFQRTGCYRCVLSPDWDCGPTWQSQAETLGEQWLRFVSDALSGKQCPVPTGLNDLCRHISDLAEKVALNDLRVLHASPEEEENNPKRLCQALIRLHAIADCACGGFGLHWPAPERDAPARCFANLLLTATGSLSSLQKHDGIVLPKMRTPQSGLTVRSLSHHVTYHCSEVEVMWRAVPWMNLEENTLNILAIPWPSAIDMASFAAADDRFNHDRCFRFQTTTPDATESTAVSIARLIKQVQKSQNVHVVVLPEMSLLEDDMIELLELLHNDYVSHEIDNMPMIISGVICTPGDSDTDHSIKRTASNLDCPTNEARLAVYFASRWYLVSQRKHHRWKLNRDQIRQYGLEGRLSTARAWIEDIDITQRRLTFLAPAPWLTLCPLICEDLAQLEPVSEVIRGVGPNVLFALLLDGPQLENRWAARYANVLADDPGTAVLSLTCAGMVANSQKIYNRTIKESPGSERTPDGRTIIGLWRDQIERWKKLGLESPEQAILLTISAAWNEEYTADGRSDNGAAAVFKYEGHNLVELEPPDKNKDSISARKTTSLSTIVSWSDVRELSAATYALNAILGLPETSEGEQIRKRIINWMLARPQDGANDCSQVKLLMDQLCNALLDPASAGILDIDPNSETWPTKALRHFGNLLLELPLRQSTQNPLKHLKSLVHRAQEILNEDFNDRDEMARTQYFLALATLSIVYMQLDEFRRTQDPKLLDDDQESSDGKDKSINKKEANNLYREVKDAILKAKRLNFAAPARSTTARDESTSHGQ